MTNKPMRIVLGLSAFLLLALTAQLLGEQQVNVGTSGNQFTPDVAALNSGEFFVVWSGENAPGDADLAGILGRLVSADGQPIGSEILINQTTAGSQFAPRLTSTASGSAFAAWTSQVGGVRSVRARRISSTGVPVGDEILVSDGTYIAPDVAALPNGNVAVAWGALQPSRGIPPTLIYDVKGQLFDSSGAPVGNSFTVNDGGDQNVDLVELAPLGTNEILFAWSVAFNNFHAVYRRSVDLDGQPTSATSELGMAGGAAYNTLAGLDSNAAGELVVSWSQDYPNPDGVRALFFDSNGDPVGNEILLDGGGSSVSRRPDGGFDMPFVTQTAAEDLEVGFTRFDDVGNLEKLVVPINSFTSGDQRSPRSAVNHLGDFVVVWQSEGSFGSDNDGTSIQVRQTIDELFANGFESGDLLFWDSVVP